MHEDQSLTLDVPSLESYGASNFVDESSEVLAEAFGDVLDDPAVGKDVATQIRARAPLQVSHYHPTLNAPIQSPALSPAERIYAPAMGPRPQHGRPAVGLGMSPQSESTMAGLSLLVVGLSGAYGSMAGGARGGAVAVLAAGAGLNLIRATKANSAGDSREALISGTFSVLGLAAAGYLWWKGNKFSIVSEAKG